MSSNAAHVTDFYDALAPFYDLIFPNWEATVVKQGEELHSLICSGLGDGTFSILDASCGIGTQSLGLAALGHRLTASDISPGAIARARAEAEARQLQIDFRVADMRRLSEVYPAEQFDVILSADNSVPHLLTDEDILAAFCTFFERARSGGICLLSVRDYEREDGKGNTIRPYPVKQKDDGRYMLYQVWDVRPPHYKVSLYCVKDSGAELCDARVFRSDYYMVPISRLVELLLEAGFSSAERRDGVFNQPVIIARKD